MGCSTQQMGWGRGDTSWSFLAPSHLLIWVCQPMENPSIFLGSELKALQ